MRFEDNGSTGTCRSAASGGKDLTKLKFLLLAKAGPDVQEVFQSIPNADVVESDDINPYEVALDKLEEYFVPKHHDSMEQTILMQEEA